MPSLDTVRITDVRIEASPVIFLRGKEYARDGAVRELLRTRQGIRASVRSSRRRPHGVSIAEGSDGMSSRCDCPYFRRTETACKHIVATLLVWIDRRDGVRRLGPQRPPAAEAPAGAGGHAARYRRGVPHDPLDALASHRESGSPPLQFLELAMTLEARGARWAWRVDMDGEGPGLLVSGWTGPSPGAEGDSADVSFRIEPRRVPSVLADIQARSNVAWSPDAGRIKIRRTPVRLRLTVDTDSEGDVVLSPVVDVPGSGPGGRVVSPEDLLSDPEGGTWIADGKIFWPVIRKSGAPVENLLTGRLPSRFEGTDVPVFLRDHLPILAALPGVRISESVKNTRVLESPSLDEVRARAGLASGDAAASPEWFRLDPIYRTGEHRLSLSEVLGAGKDGWLRRGSDWIPVRSDALLDDLAPVRAGADETGVLVPRVGLLRASATWGEGVRVDRDGVVESLLSRLAEPRALVPPPDAEAAGMHGTLRHYQVLGYEWLWWLRECGFGGILADEMGLGKTHEVMALLLAVYSATPTPDRPSLVVCPRSVLDHWETKVGEHAPALAPMVFHGLAREKDAATLRKQRLILTTYGIVARSAKLLGGIEWEYVVLDEAQKIKNPATLTSRFARTLSARHRLAITGTPIENRAVELWSIMEFLVPGYLGATGDFQRRFAKPIEAGNAESLERLRRAVRPFKLRRLKRDVLTELPPKVEDYRVCRLSPHQSALYREILSRRARPLLQRLRDPGERIDYMHIFAVLSTLKRLCDHPALITRGGKKEALVSGKFEVFKELLEEILEADEKVVVFSQYLEMLDIIEHHLDEKKIGFASLRGNTVDRRGELRRFAENPECRVFVGSLLAGGLGIDLTAASVVIHYDRWWNAARENQATDRVHRIGQARGVQVWKLITLGTLEERIDRMIRDKGALMDSVVESNEWANLKSLSRDELIDLLSPAS